MLQLCTLEEAVARNTRRCYYVNPEESGFKGHVDPLFDSIPGEPTGSQAFLVNQAPNWVLRAHYHRQHQFQIIVGGSGRLGAHELRPGAVHYASPEAPYGPIVAGGQGLEYFSLRVITDIGIWYMPEARSTMQAGLRKEQLTADPADGASPGVQKLIEPRADGLGAWQIVSNKGEAVRPPGPYSRAGRFHVVLAGALRMEDGRDLPRYACIYWVPPGEAPEFEALEDGTSVVVVQFPEHAIEHRVPPELLAMVRGVPGRREPHR